MGLSAHTLTRTDSPLGPLLLRVARPVGGMGKGNPREKARERQEALEEQRGREKAAAAERAEAEAWKDGGNDRGAKRQQEAERKAAEKAAARDAMKAALAEEEALASGAKAKVKSAKSKAKDAEMKELQAQLRALEMAEAAKKAAKKPAAGGSKKGGKGRASTPDDEVEEDDEPRGKGFLAPPPLEANPNRIETDFEAASGIDDALNLLGGGGKEDKHPEKRAKAAYKAFEERMLPEVKADYPGLKLSQYKERIFEMWKKSPENPRNQMVS